MTGSASAKEPNVTVPPGAPEPEPVPPEGAPAVPAEHGGRGGLEPTRYGDWEVGGICSDF
jgi:hypothetical protein